MLKLIGLSREMLKRHLLLGMVLLWLSGVVTGLVVCLAVLRQDNSLMMLGMASFIVTLCIGGLIDFVLKRMKVL